MNRILFLLVFYGVYINAQIVIDWRYIDIKHPFNKIGAITTDNWNNIYLVSEDGKKYSILNKKTGKHSNSVDVSDMGGYNCPFNQIGALTFDPDGGKLYVFNFDGDKYAVYTPKDNSWSPTTYDLYSFGGGGCPLTDVGAIYSDLKNYFYLFSNDGKWYTTWHVYTKQWGDISAVNILGGNRYPSTKVNAATRYFRNDTYLFYDGDETTFAQMTIVPKDSKEFKKINKSTARQYIEKTHEDWHGKNTSASGTNYYLKNNHISKTIKVKYKVKYKTRGKESIRTVTISPGKKIKVAAIGSGTGNETVLRPNISVLEANF